VRQIQCFKRVPARMHLPDLGRPWAAIFVLRFQQHSTCLRSTVAKLARGRLLIDRRVCRPCWSGQSDATLTPRGYES